MCSQLLGTTTSTWQGTTAAPGNYNVAANWNPSGVPSTSTTLPLFSTPTGYTTIISGWEGDTLPGCTIDSGANYSGSGTYGTNSQTYYILGTNASGSGVLTIVAGGTVTNGSNTIPQICSSVTMAGNLTVSTTLSSGNLNFQADTGTATFNTGTSTTSPNTLTFTGPGGASFNRNLGSTNTVISGTGNVLINSTTGTVDLMTANNTYTGTTTVQTGQLNIYGDASTGNNTSGILLGNASTPTSAVINLHYCAATTYVNPITVYNIPTSASVNIFGTSGGSIILNNTITMNNAGNVGFSSSATGSTITLGPKSSLTGNAKVTLGNSLTTVIVQGVNSYTGSTTINGMVQLNNSTANTPALQTGSIIIAPNGNLVLEQSGQIGNGINMTLSGGIFNTNNLNPSISGSTLGSLTMTASSTLNLGAASGGGSIVNFSSIGSFTSGQILTINNWNGLGSGGGTDQIIFANTSGLTSTVLGQFQFAGYPLGARLLPTGEIVPIPEPSTYIASVLSLVIIASTRLRSRKQNKRT